MSRLLSLLLVFAAPSVAQDSAVLGGWTLPEGAVVESVMSIETVGTFRMMGDAMAYENGIVKRTVTTMEEVENGRLMRALQRITSSSGKSWLDGEVMPPDPDPLLGRDVVVVRVGDGWDRVPAGWAATAEEQEELDESITLDDAEYPERPVAVGETVVVGQDAIRRAYVDVAPGEHRLTITLDSLGTRDGAPVAFLTQEVGIDLVMEGGTMRMDMTARIVRRLDWMIDIETEWEGPVRFDFDGMTLEGTMRYDGAQTVTLPD